VFSAVLAVGSRSALRTRMLTYRNRGRRCPQKLPRPSLLAIGPQRACSVYFRDVSGSSDNISGANSNSCKTPPESIHWHRTSPACVIAFTVIGGLPEFNTTMFPTMSGIARSLALAGGHGPFGDLSQTLQQKLRRSSVAVRENVSPATRSRLPSRRRLMVSGHDSC